MMKLVKIVIIGVAVVTKICLVLKFVHTMLKFKYLAIAAGYLALSGVKLWLHTKEKKQSPEVVYVTHSTHDHSFEHEDDDWAGENWKRKIGMGEHDIQEMAYARQKPSYGFLRQREGLY